MFVRMINPKHVCAFKPVKSWVNEKRVKPKFGQCKCGKVSKILQEKNHNGKVK